MAEAQSEILRGLTHVEVRRREVNGAYQYYKRWKKEGVPAAKYWAEHEHSLLMRLRENNARHVVDVISIDRVSGEICTNDAGRSLDTLDRQVDVMGVGLHIHPFFDVVELLKLMRWTLVALKEIHDIGIVHCDLSAGNICLPVVEEKEGRCYLDYSRLKLIDFAFSLHRDASLALCHPLPLDTTHLGLHYLPDFFLEAVRHDQEKGSGGANAQRVMTGGIDLYSLEAIAHEWYENGFRPRSEIRTGQIEKLFDRLKAHGKKGKWYGFPRASEEPLIREIDQMLARVEEGINRSPSFCFVDGAEPRNAIIAKTAVTPLWTAPDANPAEMPEPSGMSPMSSTSGHAGRNTRRRAGYLLLALIACKLQWAAREVGALLINFAYSFVKLLVLLAGRFVLRGLRSLVAGFRKSLGRVFLGLLAILVFATGALYLEGGYRTRAPPTALDHLLLDIEAGKDSANKALRGAISSIFHRGHPDPEAPVSNSWASTSVQLAPDREQLTNALASRNARQRDEAARSMAGLARGGKEGIKVADRVTRYYLSMLKTVASMPNAAQRHATAWAALSSLATQSGNMRFVIMAKRAIRSYEARTEELHRKLGRLIYDRRAQERHSDWGEYVLHLNTLARAGKPNAALMLGVIESGDGKYADAFHHMLVAVMYGGSHKQADGEIGRLMQKLVNTNNRKVLATILNDVERMARRGNPRWQLWAARISDTLGEDSKAVPWYRRVVRNRQAGNAERGFAKSELARLTAR